MVALNCCSPKFYGLYLCIQVLWFMNLSVPNSATTVHKTKVVAWSWRRPSFARFENGWDLSSAKWHVSEASKCSVATSDDVPSNSHSNAALPHLLGRVIISILTPSFLRIVAPTYPLFCFYMAQFHCKCSCIILLWPTVIIFNPCMTIYTYLYCITNLTVCGLGTSLQNTCCYY